MNITNMLKKDHEIKWTIDARRSFKDIKQVITGAPILVSLDFSKDFLIFSYASDHTIARIFSDAFDHIITDIRCCFIYVLGNQ